MTSPSDSYSAMTERAARAIHDECHDDDNEFCWEGCITDDSLWTSCAHAALTAIGLSELLAVVKAAPHNLACERIPEKVAFAPDEWAAAQCGTCSICLFNAALARLDALSESDPSAVDPEVRQ